MKLVWTEPADQDLWNILEFIANRDPEVAWDMRERFYAAAESLLEFPNMGRIGRVPGTRELILAPSYILVYGVDNSCIRILRLFHAAQDYPACVCQ